MSTHVGLQIAGTRFSWMGRHYIISDNQILTREGKVTTCITGSFIKVQELLGVGTTRTYLDKPESFKADIVLEAPNLVDWLNSKQK